MSLGLAAWGADQLMTGVNNLVQQQPHKTLMAQGLEQLGASETYAETLTDIVGFANATALANLLVKNSAKLGLSTISISLTERKQQALLNYISLKTTKLNRKFSLRREQLSSQVNNRRLSDTLTVNELVVTLNERAGSIRHVNIGYPSSGRTHNCVNCAIATDSTLAGNPASALPIYPQNGVAISVLEKQYGAKFLDISDSQNIIDRMTIAGNGARGIVFGSYGLGKPGHVFNVINQNGHIRFLDGQIGKVPDISQFKFFRLLRTNK